MSTPEGFATLTPVLIVNNAADCIEFCKNGLGAEVCGIFKNPKSGKVLHSCLKIGGSTFFISDVEPAMGMNPTGRQEFYLYVDNVEEAYQKAESAGFEGIEEPKEMFWGDKVGAVIDHCGNTWKLGQKVRDVSLEEMNQTISQMVGE